MFCSAGSCNRLLENARSGNWSWAESWLFGRQRANSIRQRLVAFRQRISACLASCEMVPDFHSLKRGKSSVAAVARQQLVSDVTRGYRLGEIDALDSHTNVIEFVFRSAIARFANDNGAVGQHDFKIGALRQGLPYFDLKARSRNVENRSPEAAARSSNYLHIDNFTRRVTMLSSLFKPSFATGH